MEVDEANGKGSHIGRASWVILGGREGVCIIPGDLRSLEGCFNQETGMTKSFAERSFRQKHEEFFLFLKHDICDQKGDF